MKNINNLDKGIIFKSKVEQGERERKKKKVKIRWNKQFFVFFVGFLCGCVIFGK